MIKINLDREEYSGILKPKSSLFPKIWKNNRINFWVVADNLRKGAALNSLQILDELL